MSKKLAGYGGIGLALLVLTLLVCLGIGSVALLGEGYRVDRASPSAGSFRSHSSDVGSVV